MTALNVCLFTWDTFNPSTALWKDRNITEAPFSGLAVGTEYNRVCVCVCVRVHVCVVVKQGSALLVRWLAKMNEGWIVNIVSSPHLLKK